MSCASVAIIISSYNGEKNISRQLDSLFNQKGVDVKVYVRDDGSSDGTLSVLQQYKNSKQPQKLIIENGENCGWKKSFLKALFNAPDADYYAFSDQDDVWFDDKLSKCIACLQNHSQEKVLMVHHNRIRCTPELTSLQDSARRLGKPLNYKNATVQEYAQGCTMVFNRAAKQLITSYMPQGEVAHDKWVGLLCYYFGEVFFLNEPLIYHIQYGSNASATGDVSLGQKKRLSAFKRGNAYDNVAADLLKGFGDILQHKSFFCTLRNAKKIKNRLKLFVDPQFKRASIKGTLMLKLSALMGKI